MDVKASLAAQSYAAIRPATQPKPGAGDAPGAALAKKAEDFAASFRATEAVAKDALVGGADPHALVEALAQTQLAVETAVTVRDKVVEAYQEILRMPV